MEMLERERQQREQERQQWKEALEQERRSGRNLNDELPSWSKSCSNKL